VLLAVFCELAKHPHHAEQVYKELDGVDETDPKALNRLSHLNAIINETLRLYPVLLTGGARKTLQEGTTIGGTYIPPHTTIVAPRFSISRSKYNSIIERAKQFSD
jgi:cytochrome P450